MKQSRVVTVQVIEQVTTGGPWFEDLAERRQAFFCKSRHDIAVSIHHGHLYFVKWPRLDDPPITAPKPGKRYLKTVHSNNLFEIVYTFRVSELTKERKPSHV